MLWHLNNVQHCARSSAHMKVAGKHGPSSSEAHGCEESGLGPACLAHHSLSRDSHSVGQAQLLKIHFWKIHYRCTDPKYTLREDNRSNCNVVQTGMEDTDLEPTRVSISLSGFLFHVNACYY